jgi:glycosyltransferase involved in cell wall biosynthesis
VRAELGIEPPYILSVGTLEPRKNLSTLLAAYATLERSAPRLVLAGARGWHAQSLAAQVQAPALRERVVLPGYVPDDLLPDLYAGAECFVYPSLYEGFGLPPLEALACGTPVITSTTSSLPEVVGDAALLVEPTRTDELAAALRRILEDEHLRDDLRRRGPLRAARFSWERCARETMQVYQHICATAGSGADAA